MGCECGREAEVDCEGLLWWQGAGGNASPFE